VRWLSPDGSLPLRSLRCGLMPRVRPWVENHERIRRIEDKLSTVVVHAWTEAAIEMPYPTYDVNLKGAQLQSVRRIRWGERRVRPRMVGISE
jgi:small-conductance mechanosensitive channel